MVELGQSAGEQGGSEVPKSSGCCGCFGGGDAQPRNVYANDPGANHDGGFVSNRVRTTKYTILSFLPKNLLEQFQRAANIYFLIISVLTSLPTSAKNPVSMIGTFVFVLFVSALKEVYEDVGRYNSDKSINERKVRVLRGGSLVEIQWQEIKVGDVVYVEKDRSIPADMLLLSSSDAEFGKCYVDTANLDGETNLKSRQALTRTKDITTAEGLSALKGFVHCDTPEVDIYNFSGSFDLSEPAPGEGEEQRVPLEIGNILLRGCVLRNTAFAWGLVLYTGHETKVMLNANDAPFKVSNVMRVMNRCLYLIFAFQGVLVLINTVASVQWKNNVGLKVTYMGSIFTGKGQLIPMSGDFVYGLESYLTFIVAYSHLIPISLYVAMEFVKLTQKFVVDNDLDIYHAETDIPSKARTSNLVEELGQVEFIFSDKTGTLTCNKMTFVGCSIGNEMYGQGSSTGTLADIGMQALDTDASVEDGAAQKSAKSPVQDVELTASGKEDEGDGNDDDDGDDDDNDNDNDGEDTPAGAGAADGASGKRRRRKSRKDGSSSRRGEGDRGRPGTGSSSRSSKRSKSGSRRRDRPLSSRTPRGDRTSRSQREKTPKRDRASSKRDRAASQSSGSAVQEFWELMALCHTVVPEVGDDGELAYQASSPDEMALVSAARAAGYVFVERTPEKVVLEVRGRRVEYALLAVLPFDSDRKRMAVVVQKKSGSGKIRLLCKGADNVILSRLKRGPLRSSRSVLEGHLTDFSKEGLRTLCVADRKLDAREWDGISRRLQEAQLVLDRKARESQLAAIYEEMEAGLDLLGATAIEDRLQDGVPEAIESLRHAGIKVWVLTGDKQETAINIGFSCKLLTQDMDVHKISDMGNSVAELRKGLADLLASLSSDEQRPDQGIVVTGAALKDILADDKLRVTFLDIALRCSACVCCRVSPAQKADVVHLVKDALPVITLAVGDGANDVSMIQAAHLGVGINGEEGTQAVRSSDYSIGQFRFLVKLLLVHGRWGYNRVTLFILYYFYKNMCAALTEFFFAWYCGFSGQLFFANWLSLNYNAIYTSYPAIFAVAYDQDVSKEMLMSSPRLYADQGPRRRGFGALAFVRWILTSFYHAAICYFVPVLSMDGAMYSDGTVGGNWVLGTASFTCLILVVTFKMAIEIRMWTHMFVWITIFSLVVYFASLIGLSAHAIAIIPGLDWELLGMIGALFSCPTFYLVMPFTVVASLLPDFVFNFVQRNYFPTHGDTALRVQKGMLRDGSMCPSALQTVTP